MAVNEDKKKIVLQWLDEEVELYPGRASAVDFYSFIEKKVSSVLNDNREEIIYALNNWLKLRSEPRTMLAVKLAAIFNLVELKSEILILLEDVKSGNAFATYYEKSIQKDLDKLINV